jgi:multicomponent K+:H+ antiporter subunit E
MTKKLWFAHPWLSLLLGTSWLLLQHSLATVHLLSAVSLGLLLPRLLHDFLPRPSGLRLRLRPALRLFVVVLWDIVRSNFTVARLILGPLSRPQPAWVTLPLTLTNPTAISLLATIITNTPGTVSCTVDEPLHQILIHALDCDDVQQIVTEIKVRYEAPLQAIFESAPGNTGDPA